MYITVWTSPKRTTTKHRECHGWDRWKFMRVRGWEECWASLSSAFDKAKSCGCIPRINTRLNQSKLKHRGEGVHEKLLVVGHIHMYGTWSSAWLHTYVHMSNTQWIQLVNKNLRIWTWEVYVFRDESESSWKGRWMCILSKDIVFTCEILKELKIVLKNFPCCFFTDSPWLDILPEYNV